MTPRDLPDYVIASKGGALLNVFVQPKAAKDEIVGVHGPALKLKVKAPPSEGRANDAVLGLLAKMLGVPKGDLELVAGAGSRHKRIAVAGRSPADLATAIEPLLVERGGR